MAERFSIDQRVIIFKGDSDLTNELIDADFVITATGYYLGDTEYADLAELFLDNNTYITDNNVTTLVSEDYLQADIEAAINNTLNDTLYKQIFYSYKYSSIRTFFKNNWKLFLPDYDVASITDDTRKELLVKAFFREMDKFAQIVDYLYNLGDIDKIPEEYLEYLGQIVGYDRVDFSLLSADASFRELLKNIIEIYKIKGSNYSFELFMNFLGFDVTLLEFWFDKRYSDDGISTNEFTSATDKGISSFYLTSEDPTTVVPDDMLFPYTVADDMIIATRDLNLFDQYLENGDYTYRQLIGDTSGYGDSAYTFFKTNILQYKLSSIGTDQDPELTAADLLAIDDYIKFLTPIYMEAQVLLAASPYAEYANNLFMMDYNRATPVAASKFSQTTRISGFNITDINIGEWGDTEGDTQILATVASYDPDDILFDFLGDSKVIYINLVTGDTLDGTYRLDFSDSTGAVVNTIVKDDYDTVMTLAQPLWDGGDSYTGDSITIYNIEPMFLNYVTAYPRSAYYGDSATYGDSYLIAYGDTPGDTYWTNFQPNSPGLKYYGAWYSGFHLNTYSEIYDSSNTESVYYKISVGDPTLSHNQIMNQISSLISKGDTGLWGPTYKLPERDIMVSLGDSVGDTDGDTSSWVPEEDFGTGTKISFKTGYSFSPGGDSRGYFRLSEAHSKERKMDKKTGDSADVGVRALVRTVDVDNGSGQSVVELYDPNWSFRGGDSGDTIVLYDFADTTSGDSNEGIFQVVSATGSGDTGADTTVMTFDSVMPGLDHADSGGFLQMYAPDWTFGNFRFPYLWDRDLEVFYYIYRRLNLSGEAATEKDP